MKLQLLPFLLASVILPAAGNSSLSGEWQIQRSASGSESTQVCTLIQKDSDLTGSCATESGPVKISGKVEGNKATWTFITQRDDNSLTVIYKGTFDSATKIAGTVTAVEYGVDGEFTATRTQ
jgi:hypothetical protein